MTNTGKTQENTLATFPATYKETTSFPATVDATIYLDGLLCLFFEDGNKCTVAAIDDPTHQLTFEIWRKTAATDNTPTNCELIYRTPPKDPKNPLPEEADPLGPTDEITIGVTGGNRGNEVSVFMPGPPLRSPGDANPAPPVSGPYHYGYSLDMEGDQIHNTGVARKSPSVLWPRFYIKNGVFYTHAVSKSTFELHHEGRAARGLGPIALAIGAAISLNTDESIEIRRSSAARSPVVTLPKPVAANVTYEIGITNNCSILKGCNFVYNDPDKTKRNDFYLYYTALDVADSNQFELFTTSATAVDGSPGLGECVDGGGGGPQPASDRAPCTALGFGLSKNP